MHRRSRLAPALLLAVLLAACTGDDGGGPTASAPTSTAPAATTAPSIAASPTGAPTTEPAEAGPGEPTEVAAPEDASVTIAGFAFEPQTIEVAVGTTVTWTNEDATAHTATFADGGPDTGSISGQSSASLTFDAAGTHDYVCAFHPGSMTGTVVVR